MPHIVIDYQRLEDARTLLREVDDLDWDFEEKGADWGSRAIALLRAITDPRVQLPDVHP